MGLGPLILPGLASLRGAGKGRGERAWLSTEPARSPAGQTQASGEELGQVGTVPPRTGGPSTALSCSQATPSH